MKKTCSLLALMVIVLASCTKNTNNYYSSGDKPAFIVQGLSDITLINNYQTYTTMSLSIAYQDSAQQSVTLSITGLPSGITLDTTWVKEGLPTFNTYLNIFDTTLAGATPGNYKLAFNVTTASGQVRSYPFTLKVLPAPTAYLGKYTNCTNACAGATYTDSVYADPSNANKIWFTNFANTGSHVYGIISFSELTIPSQTVGGITYEGNASISPIYHTLNVNYYTSSGTSCYLEMY